MWYFRYFRHQTYIFGRIWRTNYVNKIQCIMSRHALFNFKISNVTSLNLKNIVMTKFIKYLKDSEARSQYWLFLFVLLQIKDTQKTTKTRKDLVGLKVNVLSSGAENRRFNAWWWCFPSLWYPASWCVWH